MEMGVTGDWDCKVIKVGHFENVAFCEDLIRD